MNILKTTVISIIMSLLLTGIGYAAPRIAVLEFELNDITSLANTLQEQQRTASFRPLLEQAINSTGDYEIVRVSAKEQTKANSSFGYLFRFDDLAAKLGQTANADWIVVSQHSKPSFLFSYLSTHLVNVKNPTHSFHYEIELKGTDVKVTEHGVKSLAKKINESIYK